MVLSNLIGVGGGVCPIEVKMWQIGIATWALWKTPTTSYSTDETTTCWRVLHSIRIGLEGEEVMSWLVPKTKCPATRLLALGVTANMLCQSKLLRSCCWHGIGDELVDKWKCIYWANDIGQEVFWWEKFVAWIMFSGWEKGTIYRSGIVQYWPNLALNPWFECLFNSREMSGDGVYLWSPSVYSTDGIN